MRENRKYAFVMLIVVVMVVSMASSAIVSACICSVDEKDVVINFTKPSQDKLQPVAEIRQLKADKQTSDVQVVKLVVQENATRTIDVDIITLRERYTRSYEIPMNMEINENAELFTLEEVLYIVKTYDGNAKPLIIEEESGLYVLCIQWGFVEDRCTHAEALLVGEELFICRGEDVRMMILTSVIDPSLFD